MNALICDRANTIHQDLTNATLGSFQIDQNAAIAKVAFQAQSDARNDDTVPPVYLVPAGTGTGKTTFMLAFVVACAQFNQTYSAAIVLPTVKQVQEAYDTLTKYLQDDSVYLHTSVHAEALKPGVTDEHGSAVATHIQRHGPSSFAKLREYPIIVCTHERWLREGKQGTDMGVRQFNGCYRKNTFVDEMPATVSTIEATPAEVRFVIEQVERLEKSGAAIATLEAVQHRMEKQWGKKVTAFEPCILIDHFEYMEIKDLNAIGLPKDCQLRVQCMIEFLELALWGYCMLVRGHTAGKQVNGIGARKCFVAYRNNFSVHPGLMVLDATASQSSLAKTGLKPKVVPLRQVDYGSLQATHFAMPKRFKNVASGNACQDHDEFLRWVKHVVTSHTKTGDKVLIVLHKRHVEAWSKHERVVDYRERKLHLAYWGNGIGSNDWRECNTVFLFSEYHKPRHSYVTDTLAWRKEIATESTLKSAIGQRLTKGFSKTADDHRLRCFKQMACRGKARDIDANGCAAPMRLFTCMDRSLFTQWFSKLFPGAPEPSCIKDEQAKPKTKPQKIEEFLTSHERRKIYCSEIATKLGMKVKEVARAFESSTCSGLRSIGWRLVKGAGKQSQPFLQHIPIRLKVGDTWHTL